MKCGSRVALSHWHLLGPFKGKFVVANIVSRVSRRAAWFNSLAHG